MDEITKEEIKFVRDELILFFREKIREKAQELGPDAIAVCDMVPHLAQAAAIWFRRNKKEIK